MGGIKHIIVPVIDFNADPCFIDTLYPNLKGLIDEIVINVEHENYLYISTSSLQTYCEIRVMGMDGITGKQYVSEEWKSVGSLDEYVADPHRLWLKRDFCVRRMLDSSRGLPHLN